MLFGSNVRQVRREWRTRKSEMTPAQVRDLHLPSLRPR